MVRGRLGLGLALYVVTALADTAMTVRGMAGNLQMEGNPVMRAMMELMGVQAALFVQKGGIGALAAVVAVQGERAIRSRAEWIWKVPSIPWVRRWMRRGERSWIAYLPLYGASVAQAFAAASWAALELRALVGSI